MYMCCVLVAMDFSMQATVILLLNLTQPRSKQQCQPHTLWSLLDVVRYLHVLVHDDLQMAIITVCVDSSQTELEHHRCMYIIFSIIHVPTTYQCINLIIVSVI